MGNGEWGIGNRESQERLPRCHSTSYGLQKQRLFYSPFPIPHSLFPIPYSLFPIPQSRHSHENPCHRLRRP
ncbi:hypothetical protein C7T87_00870 [Xanthomonas hortorum pv. hederae]|nr:hypothetical protein C7T87_00870 [Xanthomonas hortorum pv. hederae]